MASVDLLARLVGTPPRQSATRAVERFNAAAVEQFRGVLADLAKETGARKDIQVVTSDAETPLDAQHGWDLNPARPT